MIRVFNTNLRLVKRIAFECPVTHISDTFFKLLMKFVVSQLCFVDDFIARTVIRVK